MTRAATAAGAGMQGPLLGLTLVWIVVTAASVHYNTPMLEVLQREFGATSAEVGLVPTFTLVGYVSGLVLLGPLGDRFQKRDIILVKMTVMIAAMMLAAFAPNLATLVVAGTIIGMATTATQDMIPLAAELSRPEERGKILGTLLTGVYIGILMGRIASGFVTSSFGWRAAWGLAALLHALLLPLLWRLLPATAAGARQGYFQLLRSLGTIFGKYRLLRRASLQQLLLGLSYGAFWNTLALTMATLYGLGSASTGLMAIPGAAGLIVARPVGRWVDRRGPLPAVTIGALLVFTAYVAFNFAAATIVMLVIGAVLLDFGIRSAAVANQALANGFDPAERSRTNLIFATHMFGGNAIGAMIGAYTFSHGGWPTTAATGLAITVVAVAFALFNWRAARGVPRTD